MSVGSPELLAALEVGRLRAVIEDAASDPAACVDTVADLRAALAAPPPDLTTLRELVAAIREVTRDADYPDERLRDPYNAVLAAYPCLGEE